MIGRVVVALALLVALLALPAPGLAAAPPTPAPTVAGGIRLLARGAENRFPASIRFTVEAEGETPITKATLYYKVADTAITSYAPATVKAGRRVAVEHVLDLRRHYQPPGVEILYQWRVEDEAGHRLATPWESFVLDDPRFQWRTLRVEGVELRWYRGGDSFGEALVEPTRRAIESLRREAGAEIGRPVKVYLYGSEADFQSAVDPGTHEWAGGRAFTREGVILIAAPQGALEFARRTVPHELSHVVVYQATRNPYGGLPTWLDEGLAMRAEGDLQPSFQRALDAAIRQDRLISVWALSSAFPTDARQAELSYAQSYSLVKFVVDRYGQAGLSRLLGQFREGATYDEALQAALGVDTYGLDDAWRASLGLAPALPLAATPAPVPTPAPASPTASLPTPGASAPPTATLVATADAPPAPPSTGAGCALPAALLVGGGAIAAFVGRKKS